MLVFSFLGIHFSDAGPVLDAEASARLAKMAVSTISSLTPTHCRSFTRKRTEAFPKACRSSRSQGFTSPPLVRLEECHGPARRQHTVNVLA
jgi:hypothetical protein